jgi:hypothetical protein
MHDPNVGPLNTIAARNALSGLYAKGSTPDPDVLAAARTKLATAKIDKAIREAMDACSAPLHPAQVAYLVGLIQSAGEAK